MPIRRKKIQALVRELLSSNRVASPPVPVARLARAHGARIFLQALDNTISGFLYPSGKRTVIGVNTYHPAVRQRFTIAHELGHLLLHDREQVHVDHDFRVRLRSNISSQGVDEEEMEANLFAAEVLMPMDFLEEDLRKTDTVDLLDSDLVANLARKYGVSTQALLIRLTALGYVAQ